MCKHALPAIPTQQIRSRRYNVYIDHALHNLVNPEDIDCVCTDMNLSDDPRVRRVLTSAGYETNGRTVIAELANLLKHLAERGQLTDRDLIADILHLIVVIRPLLPNYVGN